MAHYKLIVIGAGLSGLAAGLRHARTGESTLVLERHTIPGGLNSYYKRKGVLLETGLHAITNYAPKEKRSAPLNRLLRQLKIKRGEFEILPQQKSAIVFPDLRVEFTNDFAFFESEMHQAFPGDKDNFTRLLEDITTFDAFTPGPYISARERCASHGIDQLMIKTLMCPIQYYGGYQEHDLDWAQFTIMFNALFVEGFFRVSGGIKWLLDRLVSGIQDQGGEIRFKSGVSRILRKDSKICGVRLDNGEEVTCDSLLSTAGTPNTLELLGTPTEAELAQTSGTLGYVESLYLYEPGTNLHNDTTITFFNDSPIFDYRTSDGLVDYRSGVICYPGNFEGYEAERPQLRVTHLANYDNWKALKASSNKEYKAAKEVLLSKAKKAIEPFIPTSPVPDPWFSDAFTPLTVEHYTGKKNGSIYGSPIKNRTGVTPYQNCFIAGTDQGYLGIVGAMLSGLTIVNERLL